MTNAPLIVAAWRKNSREEARVTLDTFAGRSLVNVRVWFQAGDGIWRPGRVGIAFAIHQLPTLESAVIDAARIARERGLLT